MHRSQSPFGTQMHGVAAAMRLAWEHKDSGQAVGRKVLQSGFAGRTVIIGFESVGSSLVSALCELYEVNHQRLVVLSADLTTYAHVAADYPGVTYIRTTLTASNYLEVLQEYTRPGDFLVNLAVGVGSGELVHFCQVAGLLYIDTCLEPMGAPWGQGATPLDQRTNYAMRETLLAMRRKQQLRPAAASTQARVGKPQAGSRAAGGTLSDTALVADQAASLGLGRCSSSSMSSAAMGRVDSTSSSTSSMDLTWDASLGATRSSSPSIGLPTSCTSSSIPARSSNKAAVMAVAASSSSSSGGSPSRIPRSLSRGAACGLPTAVLVSGANPGMVEHFVKAALWHLTQEEGAAPGAVPRTSQEWAALSQSLGIKVIHIAERDTQRLLPQVAARLAPSTFINTWSVDGYVEEGVQPAELGWGSHEKALPLDAGCHTSGSGAAIYLARPSMSTRVRSWTPISGEQVARLITHHEAIEIAEYLTLHTDTPGTGTQPASAASSAAPLSSGSPPTPGTAKETSQWLEHTAAGAPLYRPTVHYAYRPCDEAEASVAVVEATGYSLPAAQHIMRQDEIAPGGVDHLGVLLLGHPGGGLWWGSTVSIEEVQGLARHLTPTSIQVVAGLVSGMCWAILNPAQGIMEPLDIPDYETILHIASPLLGQLSAVRTNWTPLAAAQRAAALYPGGGGSAGGRGLQVDASDPWQFCNFRLE